MESDKESKHYGNVEVKIMYYCYLNETRDNVLLYFSLQITTLSNSAGCKYLCFVCSPLKIASLQRAMELRLLTRYIFKLSVYASKKIADAFIGTNNQLLELVSFIRLHFLFTHMLYNLY